MRTIRTSDFENLSPLVSVIRFGFLKEVKEIISAGRLRNSISNSQFLIRNFVKT